ncbi:MAG: hypothetical protein LUG89_01385 [Methanosphaera sp.]|nr:hypothetical protein [Methanosphaera sp.]
MESATVLAIIILVIAIIILIYYYLQSTNNPYYQAAHTQAMGISNRVAQEEYVSNISDKVNDWSGKVKDRVQDDEYFEENESKSDAVSKKISQFIDEQSEQLIDDWDLVTHSDIDDVIKKYDALETDFNDYKTSNDKRIDELEESITNLETRLDNIDGNINDNTDEDT